MQDTQGRLSRERPSGKPRGGKLRGSTLRCGDQQNANQ
jgi:hypothetical protein